MAAVLHKFICEHSLHILALNETWLQPNLPLSVCNCQLMPVVYRFFSDDNIIKWLNDCIGIVVRIADLQVCCKIPLAVFYGVVTVF